MLRYIPWALLALLTMSPTVHAGQAEVGFLNGKLLFRGGEPLDGGRAIFFNKASGPPPAHVKYRRVPDAFADVGTDGTFLARLPAGSYYLGAIKRSKGKRVGPPDEGDVTFVSRDDIGSLKLYTVTANLTAEIGSITVTPPSTTTVPASEITTIAGKVLNAEGKPVAGSLVLAYRSQDMRGRAQFISTRTGSDGSYQLRVHEGGSYYLKTRCTTGGRLLDGENIGAYGGETPRPIMVDTGQTVAGIDIQGSSFSRASFRKKKASPSEPGAVREDTVPSPQRDAGLVVQRSAWGQSSK